MAYSDLYAPAYDLAIAWLEASPELEIRSALKQAGSDAGIPYGDEMGKFVKYAEANMGVSR